MPANILVDAGFLIALLSRRDANHRWAVEQAARSPPPWQTCQAVLSEAFFLLGKTGLPALGALLARRAVLCSFPLDDGIADILTLMRKYDDIPMNFADACLVRMTEALPDPLLLTTDSDFRLYRRHGRKVVPLAVPS